MVASVKASIWLSLFCAFIGSRIHVKLTDLVNGLPDAEEEEVEGSL